MPLETAIWLNRIGILLHIIAFFLGAPELLGQAWLRRVPRLFAGLIDLGLFILVLMLLGFLDSLFDSLPVVASINATLAEWSDSVFGDTGDFSGPLLPRIFNGLIGLAILSVIGVVVREINRATVGFVQRLTNDEVLRRFALRFGAGLFLVGSVVQLVATL